MTQPLRLSGPADVLAAIPSLLGFRPQGSMVLLAMQPDGVVACAARADLPSPGDVEQWTRTFLPAVQHTPGASAILAGFCAPDDDPHLSACFAALSRLLRDLGIPVLDMIAVLGGRWRSVMCQDSHCCPREGWPVDLLGEDFMRVRLGVSDVAASRGDLVAELDPRSEGVLSDDDLATAPMVDESDRDTVIDSIVARLVDSDAEDSRGCDSAMLLSGLRDVRVRDTVLWDLIHRHPEGWSRAAVRLADALRAAPPAFVPPVATVLAIVRWQMGDGARARIALDRACLADPDYTLALLIGGMLDHGQPPWTWRAALAELPRAACRGAVAESTSPG
ncbi:MAG: DUF4192 domain-containing protein [Actinomycetota bacterium]